MLLLASPPASADIDDATQLLRQARGRLAAADFDGALALLRHARELTNDSTTPGARISAQIELQRGEILAVLGRHREAGAAFVSALSHDPSIEPDPARHKASTLKLFRRIRANLWGELLITSDLPEANILLDGRDVGHTPYRARLTIGTHEVKAALLGRQLLVKRVVVPARQSVAVALDLEARCATLVVKTQPSGAEVTIAGAELGTTPLKRLVPPGSYTLELRLDEQHKRLEVELVAGEPARVSTSLGAHDDRRRPATGGSSRFWRRSRTWTWVALGGAAASLGAGLGFGSAADKDFDEYQALAQTERARGAELESSIRARATTANVLYGISGALVATSVVLLFLEGRRGARAEARRPPRRLGLAPLLGPVSGLQAHGRF